LGGWTRWRSWATAAALVAAAASTPALPFGKNKIAYDKFDWQVYKAPHFDVYYYPEEASQLQQVVSYAESAYVKLSQALDHEIKFRIPLIYYKTHGEFEQTNIILEFIPEFVAAFAEPFENRIVLPVDQPPDQLYELITHELTHVFEYSILFQESLGRALRSHTPLWLMEGLAEHMAGADNPLNEMVIRDAVVHNIIPPIHKVDELNFLTYRFGQAAFDYIEEKYGQEGIRNFLWEYRKVLLTSNLEKPIKEAFGVEADEFDREFRRYLQKKYLGLLLDEKEPEDYGKEIGMKQEGIFTFSPVLSPSGDLVAALTNRYDDLDLAIFSAHDGQLIRNLTKGFTNEYDTLVTEAFSGKNDLSWSAEGDRIAVFARKENERLLFIFDALKGSRLDRISIPGIDVESSPAFSPDGKSILFSGNEGGQVDIFRYDLEKRETTHVTRDEFYDSNPAWSPDGKWIAFNRRIDRYEKIFMVDASDPSRLTQLTFGDSSDIQPSFSRDGKTIYYASDLGKNRIFNLFSLSLTDGEIRQLTDIIGGCFTPLEAGTDQGKTTLAFSTYYKGRYRIFRMIVGEPVKVIKPAEQTQEPPEIEPFEPPLKLALDEKEKSPYTKVKFHVESNPSVLIGIADDGTILSNAQIILSDLLGNRRIFMNFQSVSTYSNIDLEYWNLKHRWKYGYQFLDFRDFFTLGTSSGNFRLRQSSRVTGLASYVSYPISRAYRFEGSAGYYQRTYDIPFNVFVNVGGVLVPTVQFQTFKEEYPLFTGTFSGDTTRFKEFGPYHGMRFDFTTQYAPTVSGDGQPFANHYLDYRAYAHMTKRSLIAWRLFSAVSNTRGDSAQFGAFIYSIGGFNQIRGYAYREFFGNRVAFSNIEVRFPLVDELRFPFGAIRMLRGFLFFDVGAAWFNGDRWYDPDWGGTSLAQQDPPFVVPRKFDLYDSQNHMLGDGRASYGLGFSWFLGPFELTWTWAKRLENSVVAGVDTNGDGIPNFYTRIPDPFFDHGVQQSFYIGTSF
jgi:Tol biopolymer transport system component